MPSARSHGLAATLTALTPAPAANRREHHPLDQQTQQTARKYLFYLRDASHTGTVARACQLKEARQHLQAPLTSLARPGLHFTQPPDIRGPPRRSATPPPRT